MAALTALRVLITPEFDIQENTKTLLIGLSIDVSGIHGADTSETHLQHMENSASLLASIAHFSVLSNLSTSD